MFEWQEMHKIFLLNVVWVGMQIIFLVVCLAQCSCPVTQDFSPLLYAVLILFWSELCYCASKESEFKIYHARQFVLTFCLYYCFVLNHY
jgi:hypothetical protein